MRIYEKINHFTYLFSNNLENSGGPKIKSGDILFVLYDKGYKAKNGLVLSYYLKKKMLCYEYKSWIDNKDISKNINFLLRIINYEDC